MTILLDPGYIFTNAAGLCGVAILLLGISRKAGSITTHIHFFSIVWAANIAISQLALGGRISPQVSTLIVLYAAWWAFLLASWLMLMREPSKEQIVSSINRRRAVIILLGLVALQWIAVISEIRSYASSAAIDLNDLLSVYPALRTIGALADINLPWYLNIWRWAYVWYVPLVLLLYSKRVISKRLLAVVWILAAISTLVHYTRAPVVQLLAISLISWLTLYRPRATQRLFAIVATATAVLILFVSVQQSLMSADQLVQSSLSESLLSYLGLSPRAYEQILLGRYHSSGNSFYSLDFIYFALYKLDLIRDYQGVVRPFIYDPFPTNLYTFLDAFTLDFGVLGALTGAFVIGLITTASYRLAQSRLNLTTLVTYSYFAYACIMAPANNEFIRFAVPLTIGMAWLLNHLAGVRLESSLDSDRLTLHQTFRDREISISRDR